MVSSSPASPSLSYFSSTCFMRDISRVVLFSEYVRLYQIFSSVVYYQCFIIYILFSLEIVSYCYIIALLLSVLL